MTHGVTTKAEAVEEILERMHPSVPDGITGALAAHLGLPMPFTVEDVRNSRWFTEQGANV